MTRNTLLKNIPIRRFVRKVYSCQLVYQKTGVSITLAPCKQHAAHTQAHPFGKASVLKQGRDGYFAFKQEQQRCGNGSVQRARDTYSRYSLSRRRPGLQRRPHGCCTFVRFTGGSSPLAAASTLFSSSPSFSSSSL